MEVLIGLLVLVLIIWFIIWVFMLIADMATHRNRNAVFSKLCADPTFLIAS